MSLLIFQDHHTMLAKYLRLRDSIVVGEIVYNELFDGGQQLSVEAAKRHQ